MLSNIYTLNNAIYREKMAAFDYDWTLVSLKNGKTFPTNIDDWEWLYPTIPQKIQKYYNDGFMIVIITNQSKDWKHEQIKLVAKTLDIPIFILVSISKCDYKPNPKIFNLFIGNYKINKKTSFFIGDAIGRKSEFSDSDKVFAENIGVSYYCPELVFHTNPEIIEMPIIPLSNDKQIIIMMGYPGSGKSIVAKNICKNENFAYIEG